MKPEILIREAWPDELPRIREILSQLIPISLHAHFIVGIIEEPIERIHCFLSWWKDYKNSCIYFLPQSATAKPIDKEHFGALVQSLMAQTSAANLSMELRLATPLADANPLAATLNDLSFTRRQTERNFQVSFWTLKERISALSSRMKTDSWNDWRVDFLKNSDAAWVMNLFIRHGLVTPEQFHALWHASNGSAIDRKTSGVVFFKEKPVGALLTSRENNRLHIVAIASTDKKFSSRLTLLLAQHLISNSAKGLPTTLTFRADEKRHQTSLCFAQRTDAVECPPTHEFTLPARID